MPQLVSVDLDRTGTSFIPVVIDSPDFQKAGVVYGRGRGFWWVVVDPWAHPFYVWRKSGDHLSAATYSSTARALGGAVFTNGPMMGKRFGPARKVTKRSVAWEFLKRGGLGAAGGLVAGSRIRSSYGRCLAASTGAAIGLATAYERSFKNWVPCGAVYSCQSRINDRRNFDDEGRTHAWFGRFSRHFASYCIGIGDLPAGVLEGVAGLILLVRDYEPTSKRAGEGVFNQDFAQLSQKRGVVAWGLAPLPNDRTYCRDNGSPHKEERHQASPSGVYTGSQGLSAGVNRPEGVIVVIGSRWKLDAEEAQTRLCVMGVRDAVATDQSGCIMMGAGREFMVRPPPPHRQAMQTYGMCCL